MPDKSDRGDGAWALGSAPAAHGGSDRGDGAWALASAPAAPDKSDRGDGAWALASAPAAHGGSDRGDGAWALGSAPAGARAMLAEVRRLARPGPGDATAVAAAAGFGAALLALTVVLAVAGWTASALAASALLGLWIGTAPAAVRRLRWHRPHAPAAPSPARSDAPASSSRVPAPGASAPAGHAPADVPRTLPADAPAAAPPAGDARTAATPGPAARSGGAAAAADGDRANGPPAAGPQGRPPAGRGPRAADHEAARDAAFALAESRPAAGDIELRCDVDGRITGLDAAAAALLGPGADRLLGRPLGAILSAASAGPGDPGGVAGPEAGRPGWPGEGEDIPLGPPDAPRWFAFTSLPIEDDGGRLAGWRRIGRDVTGRRAAEAELRAARERAEAASAAKSRFLAMVSHEIRTPLNGILGMTGLMMQTALTPEQRTYARAVETSGEALLLLIEDLLDFSKIEAGRLDLAPRPTPLGPTVEELVELLAPRASAKGIELAAYVDPRLPAEVMVDPVRLKQVLFNLAGNGIKFTAEGGVAVEVWDAGPADGEGRRPVLFQVRDTGIGVGEADSERIFQEFEQAVPGPSRSYGGTGLGLSIARRLVRLMGGDISLESRPGAGACFAFTVPLAPHGDGTAAPGAPYAAEERAVGARAAQERLFSIFAGTDRRGPEPEPAEAAAGAVAPLAGRALLVVSHALVEAPLLVRRLFDAGAEVGLATQRDLESTLAGAARPDAVLIDAAAGDPLALLDRLRAVTDAPAAVLIDPRERPLLPDLQAAGYGAYLIKPVRARSLLAAVATLLGEGGFAPAPAEATPVAAAVPARRPPRVLLCDDNEINLLLGRGLLERLGAEVTTAPDGRRAVQAALDADGRGEPVDLVLMDLHMPEMDGVEAARRIRAGLAGRAPRLAALTADLAGGEDARFEPGLFDAFLAKPLMPEMLAGLIVPARAAPSGS